jgi:hypothetical protein
MPSRISPGLRVSHPAWAGAFTLVLAALAIPGCGGGQSQVSFVSQERPDNGGETSVRLHSEEGGERQLPTDSEVVEPEHPLVGTKSERALVHIHTPDGVCSGAVVGASTIVTAQQCIKGFPAGSNIVPEGRDFHVEVATSSLTWTQRRVKKIVLPSCEWADLDVAALILEAPVDWVVPLTVGTMPGPGAKIEALGFGTCPGEPRTKVSHEGGVLNVEGEASVVDVRLCRGDVGGPIVDRAGGDIVGIISHRDDPEGSPRQTTTVFRLDTPSSRELLQKAEKSEPGKLSIACKR